MYLLVLSEYCVLIHWGDALTIPKASNYTVYLMPPLVDHLWSARRLIVILILIYFRLTSVHTYRLTFMAVRKKVRLGIVGETIHKDGRVFFQYAWETTHLLWRRQEEEGSPLYSVLYSLKGKAYDFKHKNGGCISMKNAPLALAMS